MTDETVSRKWYSGMLSTEDWWAVWLSLLMVLLGLMSIFGLDLVGWVAKPSKWGGAVAWTEGLKSSGDMNPIVAFIVTYAIFTILTCIGAKFMKWDMKKYFWGWTLIYLITWACWYIGHNAHLAAMKTQYDKFDIGWSLNMGSGASYLLALFVGLIIGNFMKKFADFLKDAAKPEWYIKTAIVFLGVKLGVKSMDAAGKAFELAITGVCATVVAYMLFWPLAYLLARKGFKMSREWAACIGSGVSICGVSAAVATGGAIRARTFVPVVVAILVVICTIFMIVGLPPLYTALFFDEPMVAGSAVGMTVKTDGGDAATGAILEEMMIAKAATKGKTIVASHDEKEAAVAAGADPNEVWEKGWILNAAIMTKIWIDMFIGIWAFVLALIWVNKVERKPGQTRVPKIEIWFRFPKFVLGYLVAWMVYVLVSFAGPDTIAAAKAGAKPVQGTMRHLFFMLTFTAIGVITNFAKLKGIGKPAAVYVIMQFIIIPPIALAIAWVFHHGMIPG